MYIIIALVIVAGAFLLFSNRNKTMAPTTDDLESTESVSDAQEERMEKEDEDEDEDESDEDADVKVVTVKGSSFKFDPKEIRVKKGQKVRIEFENVDGMHDWVIDEFDARTDIIKAGESDSVEFTADKVGTFEYYCSVGTHRQMGMVGKLIVE